MHVYVRSPCDVAFALWGRGWRSLCPLGCGTYAAQSDIISFAVPFSRLFIPSRRKTRGSRRRARCVS